MNMYTNTVYTCCIRNVACNCMSYATYLMQLHKFAVACVACNWISCMRQLQNPKFLVVVWPQHIWSCHVSAFPPPIRYETFNFLTISTMIPIGTTSCAIKLPLCKYCSPIFLWQLLNCCINDIPLHCNSQYYVGIHTYQTIKFHGAWKSTFELKLKTTCIH